LRLKLIYPHEHVSRPVLSSVVLRTGIPLNILEAKVTHSSAELTVEVPGGRLEVEKVASAFKVEGVTVKVIEKAALVDGEKCVSCGACISPCPVGAIKWEEDLSVTIKEEKCIRCRICVDTCPMHAITIL